MAQSSTFLYVGNGETRDVTVKLEGLRLRGDDPQQLGDFAFDRARVGAAMAGFDLRPSAALGQTTPSRLRRGLCRRGHTGNPTTATDRG